MRVMCCVVRQIMLLLVKSEPEEDEDPSTWEVRALLKSIQHFMCIAGPLSCRATPVALSAHW
jgi:hypothetical protein